MSSKDSHLYNPKKHNLSNGKPISSSTALSFTSQLSSLINTSSNQPTSKTSTRLKPKKDDLFRRPKGSSAKRAKRDHEDGGPAFEQKHTTHGETLDSDLWKKSQQRMEEKARLYAAMKRGDVEDADEKYAVDFDRKWAERHPEGDVDGDSDDDGGSEAEAMDEELIEYTDEFGRTRKGTRAEAARIQRCENARTDLSSDKFTARPSAPTTMIFGDTIQHAAFNPDDKITFAMDELAKKRDRSLTPPPEAHFDGSKEVRNKGTGFFQFSEDKDERARQMEDLANERAETERRREEGRKRKADEFLEELGLELGYQAGTEETERIDAAIVREEEEEEHDKGG